jgi:1,4-alpha-glucan branching enzyme
MATKKQSTPAVVAEKPAKTAKAEKAVKVAATTVEKAVKAEKAPKAAKADTTAKTAPKAAKSVKVTFVLPKEAVENAETVALLGDFNNWQNGLTLVKQKDGSFQTAVELEKGRSYEYRFLINGEKWENDWAAEAYVPTPFGTFNSVVTA